MLLVVYIDVWSLSPYVYGDIAREIDYGLWAGHGPQSKGVGQLQ
jgi:hypothetical protein